MFNNLILASLGLAALAFLQIESDSLSVGQDIAQQLAASEWLGPLAPIALSPFFGLSMLSGLATYGPEWLGQRSGLFSDGSSFNSPGLFWTMLTLAVLTSLPRLTKLSKTLAVACESVEAYSSIIILVAIRLFGSMSTAEVPGVSDVVSSTGVAQAGLTADIVVSIAIAINIIVVNGVKLFLELLIWVVPFPTVDAILEACIKLMCIAMMALYCFSPMLASLLNLTVLAVSCLVFGWIRRLTRFYREIALGPFLAMFLPNWFAQRGEEFHAFTTQPLLGLPRYAKVRVQLTGSGGYFRGRHWLRVVTVEFESCRWHARNTLTGSRLSLACDGGGEIELAHRNWVAADALYTSPNELPASTTPA